MSKPYIENTLPAAVPASSASSWPWIMTAARLGLFVAFQALFALGFLLAGWSVSWTRGGVWWPYSVTLANLVCLFLLIRLYKAEGKNYWSIFRIDRAHLRQDLLALLGVLVIAGPVAYLPNVLLAKALFGDSLSPVNLLIRPIPAWAVYGAMILFPVTQGLVELPTYFLYALPRIEAQTHKPWLALTITSLALGVQHIGIPLLFDARFITWRLLMFIPFAFLVGIVLRWRPRLLPYLAVVHVLLDMATAALWLSLL